jgi:hypothetical protein
MAKSSGKKKQKPEELLDSEGNWILEKNMVKGAVRRIFRQSPNFKIVLTEARVELPPKTLKDGSIGAKNQIRFRCAACKDLYPQKFVQVDHILPVIKLHKTEAETDYNEMIPAIVCKKSNLQVMCSTPLKSLPKGQTSCHWKKSNKENFIRAKFSEYKKNKHLSNYEVEKLTKEFESMYENHINIKKQKELEKEEKRQAKLIKKSKKLA